MDISKQVESWIEWSKAVLPATGDIPKINSAEVRPPWLEHALETVQILAYDGDEAAFASFSDSRRRGGGSPSAHLGDHHTTSSGAARPTACVNPALSFRPM
jgi:hypothetical protein